MDSLGPPLLYGFANLIAGLGIGWYAYKTRSNVIHRNEDTTPEKDVVALLEELREAMFDQAETWDVLQETLSGDPIQSARELAVHLRTNRLYGRLLKSYGSQLEHADPEHLIVPDDIQENVAARREEIGDVTSALEKFEEGHDASTLTNLAERLTELERSNEDLRRELNAARSKISEQKEHLVDARIAAFHDHLTELPNRRAFDLRLEKLEAAFRETDRTFCLLMIDLDHFKALNDVYGHDAGDAMLKVAAHMITESCGAMDAAFRYGGEEFAVLASESDLTEASELAERIRNAIAQASLHLGEAVIRQTCSIGIAQAERDRLGRGLIRSADDALYVAKNAGRNVIHVAALSESISGSLQVGA